MASGTYMSAVGSKSVEPARSFGPRIEPLPRAGGSMLGTMSEDVLAPLVETDFSRVGGGAAAPK